MQIPGLRSVDIDDIPMSYTEQLQGMNDMSGGMGGMPMGGDMVGEMGDMSVEWVLWVVLIWVWWWKGGC